LDAVCARNSLPGARPERFAKNQIALATNPVFSPKTVRNGVARFSKTELNAKIGSIG
jgi:hypothetical protein